jgi:hypothetical protein
LYPRDIDWLGWQTESDSVMRDGATGAERDRIKEFERENWQLRQVNEKLKKAPAQFAQAELDSPFKATSRWSTITRRFMGSSQCAEPCKLPFLLPGRCLHAIAVGSAIMRVPRCGLDPSKGSTRQPRDAVLRPEIKKVWNDNWQGSVYVAFVVDTFDSRIVGSAGDAYDRTIRRHRFMTTSEGFGRGHQWTLQNLGHPATQ